MITFAEVMAFARSGEYTRLCYSSRTSWWTHDVEADAASSSRDGAFSIPLDPSRAPLLETALLTGLQRPLDAPEHYGEGGVDLFMFSHHRNCGGRCFADWDEARAAWIAEGRPRFS